MEQKISIWREAGTFQITLATRIVFMRLFSDGTSMILSVLSTVLKYSAFPHSLKSSGYQEPVCEKRSHNCDQGSLSSKVIFLLLCIPDIIYLCASAFKHGMSLEEWEVKKPSWALQCSLFLPGSDWSFCRNWFSCSGYSNENLLVKICESLRATAVTFLCCWAMFCTLALWLAVLWYHLLS